MSPVDSFNCQLHFAKILATSPYSVLSSATWYKQSSPDLVLVPSASRKYVPTRIRLESFGRNDSAAGGRFVKVVDAEL